MKIRGRAFAWPLVNEKRNPPAEPVVNSRQLFLKWAEKIDKKELQKSDKK